MTTRHLSVSLTSYSEDHWSVALLETTCEPGRPARSEALRLRTGTADECYRAAMDAVAKMRAAERNRTREAECSE